MRKTLLFVAAGAFLLGFGTRLLLEPGAGGSSPVPGPQRAAVPSPRGPPGAEEAPRAPGAAGSQDAPPLPGAPEAPAPASLARSSAGLTLAELSEENARLRTQLAALQAQADGDRKVSELERGTPLAPPERLDRRFSQEALRTALAAAFVEAGLPNSVTSVDCTEYPCMIYGEGKGGPEEFQRLFSTGAMGGYAADTHNAFGWSTGDGTPERPRRDFLGLAIYPADDAKARGPDLRRRLKYRSAQMAETFDGN